MINEHLGLPKNELQFENLLEYRTRNREYLLIRIHVLL